MRQIVGLLVGLAFGIAGTFLFLQSLPPKEGSAEDRAEVAELELSRAQMRIKELEAIAAAKSNLNLLFYDFNSGGAKEAPPLLDGSPSELKVPAANPYRNTTSYFFKGGDRLPTRENASRGGADVESRRSIARTKNQLHLES